MSWLVTGVSFVIVLGVLVFFHELGHYWIARRNGIVVEEFGMGYPPRLIKLFRYDGTDFTINLIPFGGFARMKGEDASDMSPGSFNAASRAARAATLFAGPAMNALLAVVLFALSYMAGFPAAVAYPQLATVADGSAAAALGLQSGDILLKADDQAVQVSAIPDYRSATWHSSLVEKAPTTLTVGRQEQVLELPFQGSLPELLASIEYRPVLDTRIELTAEGSPAQLAGLQPGDLIYRVNDEVINYANPLNQVISENLGQEVMLTVWRDQEWRQFTLTPRVNPPAGQGALGVQIGYLTALASLPLLSSLWLGITGTVEYFFLVLQLPIMLLMGTMSPADAQLSGPVGIATMVGGAARATIDTGLWFPIWRLSAVLSAALAVTNLLPLPALDGGRLLFILIETLRGRRINPEREGLVHMVGFMLLIGLLVYITVQDIRTDQVGIDWRTMLGR
jgi:regulator of sigma E protease